LGACKYGKSFLASTRLLTYSHMPESCEPFHLCEAHDCAVVVRLVSEDGTNRLTRARVQALTAAIEKLAERPPSRLVITGDAHFFSAGADLNEIAALTGPQAFRFAQMGQRLMEAVANFPSQAVAAVQGYCMGGGLDLALACHRRIAGPHALFGHRGAALGLITGWGGTQRLPRLIGKAGALQMFLAAEKLHASRALEIGLIDAIVEDPVETALAMRLGR
jgi:enoyl-CoA hydratase/carnithine racemase